MARLLLPQRFLSQPQSVVELSPEYRDAELLSLTAGGGLTDIAKGNHLKPGVAPTPVLRGHGLSFNFEGVSQYLVSTRTLAHPAQFTVFAWVTPSALNINYRRIVETDFATGMYLGSNVDGKYAWIVKNSSLEGCIGGQQVVGQRDLVLGTFNGTTRALYVNGRLVASAAATAPSSSLTIYVGRSIGSSAGFWKGDIDGVGIFPRAFSASEVLALYQTPWRLFRAPTRNLWVESSAITTHNLTVSNATQANTASEPAVTQAHEIAGANSTQSNTAVTGAITQDQALTVASAAQGNTASTGAVSKTEIHNLTVSNAVQANTGGTAAVTQAHVLVHSPSIQDNIAADSAVVQLHVLAIANATQANAASEGEIAGIGANDLTVAPVTQTNTAGTGRITRPQTLTIANAEQINGVSTGAVSDGIIFEAALATVTPAAGAIKKPGIPNDTPAWLKTSMEIVMGRRGNRINVPEQQTLTFSATPTQAECEALYNYTNTVRDSLAQLINRLDS